MHSAEHWDNLAAQRDRQAKVARGRGAVPDDAGISSRHHMYAYLLDVGLSIVTLGIGWLVWSLLAWRRGQSPAKQLMGMYVVHDGRRAGLVAHGRARDPLQGRRRVRSAGCWRGLRSGVSLIPYFFWLASDPEHQALWDRPAGTHVMEERDF